MEGSRAFPFFPGASTELMRRRELLRRVDTKFVVPTAALDGLLEGLNTHYACLRVPSGNVATYESLYFDTTAMQCFHDHRRGRRIRHKIRIRHYPDRQVSFLEIKTKRNETVTDKHRLAIPFGSEVLGDGELAFLREHIGGLADELRPELRIGYRRLSLIGVGAAERVTIDLDMSVAGSTEIGRLLGHLAVVEVKQESFSQRTPIMRSLRGAAVREMSLSKYVIAVAVMRPELRRNRFLPDLRSLERI